MKTNAVFAGTFDPFTLGHYDIAARAAKTFDTLFVAVADTSEKRCMFDLEKRIEIVKRSLSEFSNVKVVPFKGFLVDFMRSNGVGVIARGLRNTVDFEYEKNLFAVYRSQMPEVECCYFISDPSLAHISSSLVREVISLGGNAEQYMCEGVKNEIIK